MVYGNFLVKLSQLFSLFKCELLVSFVKLDGGIQSKYTLHIDYIVQWIYINALFLFLAWGSASFANDD